MDLRVFAVITLLFSGVCASNGMDETGGGEAEEDGFEATQLILISPNGSSSYGVKNAVSILKDVSFNQSLPTVFFIHGFRDNRNSDSVTLVTKAFVRNGSHNVIAVDWSAYNSIPYLSAFENMRGVGRTVGDALNRMVKAGLPSNGIWLVGHSLGAQMTAILSRTAMFDVQKITGLDPALPGFKVPGGTRLTRDAARLVEVVHTDSGVFGFDESCGDIDIWPNGGTAVQPGCLFSLEDEPGCSHTRSYRYFAESVENSLNFPAVKCSSWFNFRRGACPINDTNVVFLGQNQPGQNNTGNYFLTTNRSSPYGRGLQGVAGSD